MNRRRGDRLPGIKETVPGLRFLDQSAQREAPWAFFRLFLLMGHDQLFKDLLRAFLPEFLELFLPDAALRHRALPGQRALHRFPKAA